METFIASFKDNSSNTNSMNQLKTLSYGSTTLRLVPNNMLKAVQCSDVPTTKKVGTYNIVNADATTTQDATAQPVYNIAGQPTLVVPTGDFYVEFTPETSQNAIQDLLLQHDLRVEETVAEHAFILSPNQEEVRKNAIDYVATLQKEERLAIVEPDLMADMAQYDFQLPTDELIHKQWYLENHGLDPYNSQHWKYRKGADAKVIEAWRILSEHKGFLSSSDITIAVVDKGFDLSHPDFEDKIIAPRDFHYESSSLVAEPFAVEQDDIDSEGNITTEADHGTSCAGIALAKSNGAGVVGVAPNSKFMPIRYYVANGRFMRLMFRHMMENGADVASCSFGNIGLPMDSQTIRTLRDASIKGRNGRGMVIVFATGNAYDFLQQNEIATHPNVIAVGASTSEDTYAPYSNRTTNMSVVAPGGYGHSGTMTTTDVGFLDALNSSGELVSAGKGKEENPYYRNNAEGTSFACPVVAGVAALVLSANPNLTAKEVKSIIETTADKIGDAGEYDAKGHSPKFGYGRVNAANAVRKALGLSDVDYPTHPPLVDDVPAFSFDYGQTIAATHDVNSEEVTIKYTVHEGNAGKHLVAELEIGLGHDKDNEFELFVQKDKKPVHFPEDFIEKRLAEQPRLELPKIAAGDYFFMVRCINKKSWDYIKGGGNFELTFTFQDAPVA